MTTWAAESGTDTHFFLMTAVCVWTLVHFVWVSVLALVSVCVGCDVTFWKRGLCQHTHTHTRPDHKTHEVVFLGSPAMSFTLQTDHCNLTPQLRLLMKRNTFRGNCVFISLPIKKKNKTTKLHARKLHASSVTLVTAMHSVPDEKKKHKQATRSISLYKNNMVCCVMNSHTVALESRSSWMLLGVIFVLKHSLVCTLIFSVSCLSEALARIKKEFVRGRFTRDHTISQSEVPISHHWKGNHICRKSPLSAIQFPMQPCKACKAAKW